MMIDVMNAQETEMTTIMTRIQASMLAHAMSVHMQKGEPMSDREMYCRDCDRSIYGKYHDCDVNIDNCGKYVMADDKCYCKIVDGKRAEKYPWEKSGKGN